MNAFEYFQSINSKLLSTHSNPLHTAIPTILMCVLQTLILSLVISSFNVNALFTTTHFLVGIRTFLISFVFLGELLNKLLIKNNSIDLFQSFITRSVFIFLFLHSFIYFPSSFKFYFKGPCFIFLKFFFHSNLLFSFLNSLLLSSYLTFYSFFIANVPSYTQASGLLFYLKEKIPSIFFESIHISLFTVKSCSLVILGYIVCFHTLLKYIFIFIRISPYYNSIWDFIPFILSLCVSNGVFYVISRFIDSFILFNTSFEYDELSNDSLDVKYHRVVMSYKRKEIKLKNNSKAIKILECYILKEIEELKQIIKYFELSKRHLDSSLFIHVPQANKNCTKKYKVYHMTDALKSKIAYYIEKWLFSKRFNALVEHFEAILLLCKNIKDIENIAILSTKNQIEILEILRTSQVLASEMDMNLKLDSISGIINKLI